MMNLMQSLNKIHLNWGIVTIISFFLIFSGLGVSVYAQSDSSTDVARVDTSSSGSIAKVAPGDLLPIQIKLSNFGGGKRVDVTITYSIVDNAGEVINSGNETVAVETTASFIKKIEIPSATSPGIYFAKASANYEGQLVPANTQFSFEVERKIIGIYQSDFFLYVGIGAVLSIFAFALGYGMIRHRNTLRRFAPLDYSDIPHEDRVFFELLSDTVMQMRQRVGDVALDIAKQTNGLVIDEKSGRILKITDSPSKVIAQLVSGYEKALDQKVSFFFRRDK